MRHLRAPATALPMVALLSCAVKLPPALIQAADRQVTTRLSAISNARPKRSSAELYKPAVPLLASQSTPPVEPKVPFREAGIN